MSRAQSPVRDSAVTMNLLADKVIRLSEIVQGLQNQMADLQITKNTREPQGQQETYTSESGTEPAIIQTYDRAMHLIPEFDGSNVEAFINHVQVAVSRVLPNQRQHLLCSIIAQKLMGRTKGTIRLDITSNFPQFYEKLRFLYGKAQNLSALEVQRDTCIQRQGETVDEFINRFLRIHDEIITAVNSQELGTTTIYIQEDIYQQKAIEVFRRNIKLEIGDHLYSFDLSSLNQAIAKARAFEGELQLRKLRQRGETYTRRPIQQQSQSRPKECTYCKRRGHEEKECRTKSFHQQRNFRERPDLRRPPNIATSHHSRATASDPEQQPRENFTRDQEEHISELRE